MDFWEGDNNSMGIENRGQSNNPNQIVILQKDNRLSIANPQVQKERNLVLWAEGEGRLDILTRTERPVIEERYLSQEGVVVSFGLIREKSKENGAKITRMALYFAKRSAIAKLARVSKGEEPIKREKRAVDIGQMKKMLDAGRLEKDVAKELKCSITTLGRRIRRYRDELKLNIKRGRPRKNIVHIVQ